jgi:hypothetical protein
MTQEIALKNIRAAKRPHKAELFRVLTIAPLTIVKIGPPADRPAPVPASNKDVPHGDGPRLAPSPINDKKSQECIAMTQIIDLQGLIGSHKRVASPDSARGNRRAEHRNRCLIGGLAVDPSGAPPLDCVIRNVAPGGAGLDVGADDAVPSELFLINLKHREVAHAALAWRRRDKAGLTFRHRQSLDALPPDAAFLTALFARAKLRQIDILLEKGFSLQNSLQRSGVTWFDYERWRQDQADPAP